MAPGGPIIDSNLLAQIQTLTNQLLSKTEVKAEPEGFNTVSRILKHYLIFLAPDKGVEEGIQIIFFLFLHKRTCCAYWLEAPE